MDKRSNEVDSVEALIPKRPTLKLLRAVAADCKGCDLWAPATQTVFGEGGRRSRIMAVGEEPGNEEDLTGHPFVGPAGRLLDKALAAAGIDRKQVYLTNVVKHFKFEPRGKRRIHKRPNSMEVRACKPWLEAEIAIVKPRIILCLGATAAQALLGTQFRVTRQRGEFVESPLAPFVMATVHPSSVLRALDAEARRRDMQLLVNDLKKVARVLWEPDES
jgi:uracil-DNA glycosylase family protein